MEKSKTPNPTSPGAPHGDVPTVVNRNQPQLQYPQHTAAVQTSPPIPADGLSDHLNFISADAHIDTRHEQRSGGYRRENEGGGSNKFQSYMPEDTVWQRKNKARVQSVSHMPSPLNSASSSWEQKKACLVRYPGDGGLGLMISTAERTEAYRGGKRIYVSRECQRYLLTVGGSD